MMGNINVGRWIMGGIVTAIVLFVVDYIVNGVILAQQWNDLTTSLGLPAMGDSASDLVMFAALSLLVGLTAVWIYVGIRPRFGPGVTTAVYAGLAVWVLAYLCPNMYLLATGIFPASLLWTGVIVGVVQVPVATVAGAYLYQEGRMA
jgi:hypothetical protein